MSLKSKWEALVAGAILGSVLSGAAVAQTAIQINATFADSPLSENTIYQGGNEVVIIVTADDNAADLFGGIPNIASYQSGGSATALVGNTQLLELSGGSIFVFDGNTDSYDVSFGNGDVDDPGNFVSQLSIQGDLPASAFSGDSITNLTALTNPDAQISFSLSVDNGQGGISNIFANVDTVTTEVDPDSLIPSAMVPEPTTAAMLGSLALLAMRPNRQKIAL